MTRSTATRWLTGIVVALSVVQPLMVSAPISSSISKAIISAILMFLVVALTAWKQALSVEISNNSLWPTIIIAIIATLGAANNLINAIPISAAFTQWAQYSITLLTALLNVMSKTFFPSPESASVEILKSQISNLNK